MHAHSARNIHTKSKQKAFGFASLNGGTTGGAGGTTTTVSDYAAFTEAVSNDEPKVVVVSGAIKEAADQVKVGSNTSILGQDDSAALDGFGLLVKEKENVIIRNLGVRNVLADNGDAIGVRMFFSPFFPSFLSTFLEFSVHDGYRDAVV